MKSKVLLGCCYSFDPTRWIACAEACHPNGTREKGEDSMEVIQSSPHDDPTRKLASYTAGTVWKKNWQSDWVDTHIWIFYDLLSVSLFLILYLRVLFSFGSFPLFAPPSFFKCPFAASKTTCQWRPLRTWNTRANLLRQLTSRKAVVTNRLV